MQPSRRPGDPRPTRDRSRRLIAVAVLVLLVNSSSGLTSPAGAAQSGQLTTTFDAGEANNGATFDLEVKPSTGLTITELDHHLQDSGLSTTVTVWTRSGTAVGHENTSGGWTLRGSADVTSSGEGTPTTVPVSFSLPQGTWGVRIADGSNRTLYTNGAQVYENAQLKLTSGSGLGLPIGAGGAVLTSRIWNGTLRYQYRADQDVAMAAQPNRVLGTPWFPVPTATASSGLPVSVAATGPCTIVRGTHVRLTGLGTCTLTASQAGNADWAPASRSRSFQVTPANHGPHGFVDVAPTAFYDKPVAWARHTGVTTGIGGTNIFAPDDTVTRGQIVTFLWRLAGQPTGHPAHGFIDVAPGAFYNHAVAWAKATGVTTGIGGTNIFAPDDTVTRGQAVTFLWRAIEQPGGHGPHGFIDVAPGAFYNHAVAWAKATGVTTGIGGTNVFAPDDGVTRGQAVTFLWRVAARP